MSNDYEYKEIFVPGRLCILGEHSDWAAQYTLENPAVPYGAAIVCVTNEGLYTKCRKISLEKDDQGNEYAFIKIKSKTSNHEDYETNVKLDVDQLTIDASCNGYFSYAYGTAAVILEMVILPKFKRIDHSIEIINYETTLPMKKGLSSSAAVCVTIAKCFNVLYDLDLDMSMVMEIAYLGEQKAQSKCGRMDQCVAAGKGAIGLMNFDGNLMKMSILRCHSPLYFVVADLKAGKNTVKILESLNNAFPFPVDEKQCLMHKYVLNNHELIWKAVKAIEEGSIHNLGKAMNEAQATFDYCATDQCPSELTSPKLHSVINHQNLKAITLAIKGVGSQGDGSVQILCSSQEMQKLALRILETELYCEAFPLTVPPSGEIIIERPLRCIHRVRYAIVVMDPTTQLSIFSNISVSTKIKNNWLHLLQELIASGIEKIAYMTPAMDNDNISIDFFSNLLVPTSTEWSYKDNQLEVIRARTQFIHEDNSWKAVARALNMFTENNDNAGNENILLCKAEVIPENNADQGIKKIINVCTGGECNPLILAINNVDVNEGSKRLYLESITTQMNNGTLISSLRRAASPISTPDAICVSEGLAILKLNEANKCIERIVQSEPDSLNSTLHTVDAFINNAIGTGIVSGLSLGRFYSLQPT